MTKSDAIPPSVTPTEARILGILRDGGRPMGGLDIVRESEGSVNRGSVYVLLERMEDKGVVRSQVEANPPPGRGGMRRRFFELTALGDRVSEAHAKLEAAWTTA